ncbi:hypothetical protein IAQ61_000469 [Plenodomus lingam]|uniref:uncharacterized protein n=1 Tax=Leptosphaeria maculans TaxID=5022 RepID=UPI00332AB22D|nr:hypothetical protein IAQ61_000469 [Plenodomus lingam]
MLAQTGQVVTFVKRRPKLKVKFNRKYNYNRALCEDSRAIQAWFRLVANIKEKYGIQDKDMYNFAETGFIMGQISTGAVVTASEQRGRPKSVQQGNREWRTVIRALTRWVRLFHPLLTLRAGTTSLPGTRRACPRTGLLQSLRTAGQQMSLACSG